MTQFDKASGDTGTLKLLDRLLENENNDLWRDLHYTSGTLSSSDLNDPQDIMLLGLNAGPKVQLVGSRKFACKVAPLGKDLPMCTEIWTRVVAVSLISTHGGRLGHLHHHYSVRSSDSGHTSSCQPRDFNDLRNAPPNLKIGLPNTIRARAKATGLRLAMLYQVRVALPYPCHSPKICH